MENSQISTLYKELFKKFGHPRELWPQWCHSNKDEKLRELIAFGAILVQRMSWKNAEKALINLKENNLLDVQKIARLRNLEQLTEIIRPAGFHTTKPKRLQALCRFIVENGSLTELAQRSIEEIRPRLLDVYGVGPETSDTLLLYALDKSSFIVDEYTKRFTNKYALPEESDYDVLKQLYEDSLPRDVEVYQNFHVLIICDQKGKEWCRMKEI